MIHTYMALSGRSPVVSFAGQVFPTQGLPYEA